MAKSDYRSSLSRREALRLLTAVAGAAVLGLEGCAKVEPGAAEPASTRMPEEPAQANRVPTAASTVTETPKPTETRMIPSTTPTEMPNDGSARIAFVKTTDRANGVRQAMDLLGVGPLAGKSVFLKPNFNSADPTPGSTHLDVLRTLVAVLQEQGARKITVGDRSGMGNTRQVMEQIGVFRLAEELGFDTLVFDALTADDWQLFQPANSHWQQGFAIARPVLDADAVVQTCCLKTHRFGGHFTLSLKNSVGLAAKRLPQGGHDFMNELHTSAHQRRMIAEINAAYTPALVVLDGVEAFISGGPDRGEKVQPEVILAGADRIAVDAVGVALLRYFGCKTEAGQGKIFEQEQIARAVELGLGVDSPEKIEFVTGDAESAEYSSKIKALLTN